MFEDDSSNVVVIVGISAPPEKFPSTKLVLEHAVDGPLNSIYVSAWKALPLDGDPQEPSVLVHVTVTLTSVIRLLLANPEFCVLKVTGIKFCALPSTL